MNKILKFNTFLILWASQSISQFGSSMTSFALIIWVYQMQGNVMTVAFLAVFSYLPSIISSLFAGVLIDRLVKKKIIIFCDTVCAICTLFALYNVANQSLQIWQLYILNIISGIMNSCQLPASKVIVKNIVSEEDYGRTSGLRSLSNALITIFTPITATMIISFLGIEYVMVFDLITYMIAFISLIFLKIIEDRREVSNIKLRDFPLDIKVGLKYLLENKGILYLILFMAGINFLAGIGFYSVLPAMLLERTMKNESVLGIVYGAIGIGGIVGGLIVSLTKPPKKKIKTIFLSSGLAFFMCDIFLGIGRHYFIWVLAAFLGNIPIPFLNSSENIVLLKKVPNDILGKIYSLREAIQFFTIPLGYICGGYLADYVFEPLMKSSFIIKDYLEVLVGRGSGSGMALIFVITGILGSAFSFLAYQNKQIRGLEDEE